MSGGWNTIESDAGVFTSLLSSLSTPHIQCEELLTLDPSLLSPLQPLGLIFLFKYPTSPSSTSLPRDGTPSPDAPLWFARQTIQNACGTQALLSIVLNQPSTTVPLGPTLASFKEFTTEFDAELRGEALSNATEIRDAHNAFARASPFVSDESRQADESDDVYHFIAYLERDGRLWELDGLVDGPIDHGACAEGAFSEKVMEVVQRRIQRYDESEIRFNLLAVCRDLRERAREIGDVEWEMREEEKRRAWRWENALRKHNFVGFVGELAKGVVAQKVKTGGYESWVEGAKERTRTRTKGRGDEMDVE